MGMLERLSDARGTLEGKIVAVVLAILLVLPVATVTAFAGDDEDVKDETKTEVVTEEVNTPVVQETVSKDPQPVTNTEKGAPEEDDGIGLVNEPEIYTISVVLEPGTVIVPTSIGMGMVESSQGVPAISNQDFEFEAFTSDYSSCTVLYNNVKLSPFSGNNYVIPQSELRNNAKIEIKKSVTPDPDESKEPETNPGEGENPGTNPGEGEDPDTGETDQDSVLIKVRYNLSLAGDEYGTQEVRYFKTGEAQTFPIELEGFLPSDPYKVPQKEGYYFTGWSTSKKEGRGDFPGSTITIPGDYLTKETGAIVDLAFELYPTYDQKPLTYTVKYEWENVQGLKDAVKLYDMDRVEIANDVIDLPEDKQEYNAGDTFAVNGKFTSGTQIKAVYEDGSSAIYRFSGWMLDGQVVTGNQTINDDIVLKGVWNQMSFKAEIKAKDWTYDGTDADSRIESWKDAATVSDGENVYEAAPKDIRYFSKTYDEEKSAYSIELMAEPPKDAGTYIVQGVWEDKFNNVAAEAQFVISPRPIEIRGLEASQVYNGKALSTKDSHDYISVNPTDGIVEGEGFVANYEAELTDPGNIPNTFTVEPKGDTKASNYDIKLVPGDLKVEGRDDKNKIGLRIIGKSEKVYYDGTDHELYGFYSVQAIDNGAVQETVLSESNDSHICKFTYNGREYELSNFNSGAKGMDAGTYENKIYRNENGYEITDVQTGKNVTSQFATPDVVHGQLTIMPRPILITTGTDKKVYDGKPLVKDEVSAVCMIEGDANYGKSDLVFGSETSDLKTEGTITNVKWVDGRVSGVDNGYTFTKGDTYKDGNYSIQEDLGTLTVTPIQLNSLYVDKPADIVYNGKQNIVKPVVRTKQDGQVLDESLFEFAYSREPGNSRTYKTDPDQTNMKDVQVTESTNGEVYIQVSGRAKTDSDGNVIQNYEGTMPTDFKISPAPATIYVNNASKVYGEDDPEFSVLEIGGLFNDDKLTTDDNIQVTRDRTGLDGDPKYDAVGEYKDVLKANILDPAQVNTNYTYTVENGLFSITQAGAPKITLSAEDVEKDYDGQPATIKATLEAGDSNESRLNEWRIEYSTDGGENWTEGDEVSRTDVRRADDGSLVYDVDFRAVPTANEEYYKTGDQASGTITIRPIPVTITVDDASKIVGTADPEFTGKITKGELVEGEDLGLTYRRTNTDEGIGTYENVLTAEYESYESNPEAVSRNYDITIENGDFTITPMADPTAPETPPTPGTVDPTVTPTPGTPGPLETLVTTVTDFLATPIIGPGAMAAEGIADDETPLAQIDDEGNPLSAFDHPVCWIHYYILLGIIITAIYGGGVIARRLGYNHTIKKYENDVTGENRNSEPLKKPVAKEGAQPTI